MLNVVVDFILKQKFINPLRLDINGARLADVPESLNQPVAQRPFADVGIRRRRFYFQPALQNISGFLTEICRDFDNILFFKWFTRTICCASA